MMNPDHRNHQVGEDGRRPLGQIAQTEVIGQVVQEQQEQDAADRHRQRRERPQPGEQPRLDVEVIAHFRNNGQDVAGDRAVDFAGNRPRAQRRRTGCRFEHANPPSIRHQPWTSTSGLMTEGGGSPCRIQVLTITLIVIAAIGLRIQPIQTSPSPFATVFRPLPSRSPPPSTGCPSEVADHLMLKYFAAGWWTMIAEVDCSGSSCHSSLMLTPIRPGCSSSNSWAWSSRFGQAG